MPRYIKDGAYTIVVEDTSPATAAAQKNNNDNNNNNATPKAAPVEEEEVEEVINFSSPAFMLQNLKIAMPLYSQDRSSILKARCEVVEMICIQICFYCYVLLQPFVHRMDPPCILLMGDGFIGTKAVYALSEHGLISYLKIYSRGEFGAKEWRQRGYQASSSLQHLLRGGVKPTIILLCVDLAAIHLVTHALAEAKAISPSTAIILATLGLPRKKAYYNLSTMHVFRCFVEPCETLRLLKEQAQQTFVPLKAMTGLQQEHADLDQGLDQPKSRGSLASWAEEDDNGPPPADTAGGGADNAEIKKSEATDNDKADDNADNDNNNSDSEGEDDNSDSQPLSARPETISERAAFLLAQRSTDTSLFINQVENYYSMLEVIPEEARRTALRTVVGYVEQSSTTNTNTAASRNTHSAGFNMLPLLSTNAVSSNRANTTSSATMARRKPAVTVKAVEKIIISLYMSCKVFHSAFSRQLPQEELQRLVEQEFIVLGSARGEQLGGHHHNVADMYIDTKGKHHFIKGGGKGPRPMYNRNHVNDIMTMDEDYKGREGAGFDLMARLDALEERKHMQLPDEGDSPGHSKTNSPHHVKEDSSSKEEAAEEGEAAAVVTVTTPTVAGSKDRSQKKSLRLDNLVASTANSHHRRHSKHHGHHGHGQQDGQSHGSSQSSADSSLSQQALEALRRRLEEAETRRKESGEPSGRQLFKEFMGELVKDSELSERDKQKRKAIAKQEEDDDDFDDFDKH